MMEEILKDEESFVKLSESIRSKLTELFPITSKWSIYRVNDNLRSVNNDAYSPHIISIGPLHHGKENLVVMEEQKLRYMQSFLQRTEDPEKSLEYCVETILGFGEEARACYSGPITDYNDVELGEMLLLDGCFIVELFLRNSYDSEEKLNDPIFTSAWMIPSLQRDLALLENQIPFFVLEFLFQVIRRKKLDDYLITLVLHFFKPILCISEEMFMRKRSLISTNSRHLLDVIHYSFLPLDDDDLKKRRRRNGGSWELIHSATALREAGIRFEKKKTNNLFDFKFRNGVFKIPPLHVHVSTDSLFRNMIAFEQCCHDRSYIASYCILMDRLIDTAKDVELLEHQQIIENGLGACEDVATLFNNISKHVTLKEFYFAGLCDQVYEYYDTPWYRYKAALRRDYFTNPWSIISFIAAIVLLFLTALQSAYSVFSYYHR
ncbi:UPF0481 protein At3g47200-like [Tripterygium wilfordii]|uniref:UPF0481 protein At3g47200-like n=1 Tax=Tripterygium wilfordii TaxID=458696 RepID=UPI0018F86241|nr:UPF0481 protein At3g47200-like [Tripterygium wilfordii]XP_038682388.1 UPF0481 protein At3g47200-like [Tripterygium wilfordii]